MLLASLHGWLINPTVYILWHQDVLAHRESQADNPSKQNWNRMVEPQLGNITKMLYSTLALNVWILLKQECHYDFIYIGNIEQAVCHSEKFLRYTSFNNFFWEWTSSNFKKYIWALYWLCLALTMNLNITESLELPNPMRTVKYPTLQVSRWMRKKQFLCAIVGCSTGTLQTDMDPVQRKSSREMIIIRYWVDGCLSIAMSYQYQQS